MVTFVEEVHGAIDLAMGARIEVPYQYTWAAEVCVASYADRRVVLEVGEEKKGKTDAEIVEENERVTHRCR